MSFSEELSLSRIKIEVAEAALSDYLASGRYTPEEGMRLINGVRAARDEFIDRLSRDTPDITDL